jgi:hypothetical protein
VPQFTFVALTELTIPESVVQGMKHAFSFLTARFQDVKRLLVFDKPIGRQMHQA